MPDLDLREAESPSYAYSKARWPVAEGSMKSLAGKTESAKEEPTFDSGTKAWLQVLGAFFLWFNSWYAKAGTDRCLSTYLLTIFTYWIANLTGFCR